MKRNLLIDGKDAFAEYGVSVEESGLAQVVQWPSFKSLTSTDWPEEDGADVDLSAPVLDTRTCQITFTVINRRYAEDFFDDLSTGSYHDFYFVDLQKTYRLRMTQNGTFSANLRLGKLTLTFADDFPEIPDAEPYKVGASGIKLLGYEVDGYDLSQFGVWVLKDTDNAIQKAADTKENLKISSATVAGVTYDGESVKFKTKDVKMNLLISAPDIEEFWRRYNALYAIIAQADERTLYYSTIEAEYGCYYKSCSVSKFRVLANGHIWCEFAVTLVFLSYHPVSQYMLLATEDYDYVITEGGAYIRIRPKYGISLLVTEDGQYIVTEDEDKLYINNTN